MIQKVCLCLVMQWGESSIKVTKHQGPHLSTLRIEGSRFFLTIEISNVPQNKKNQYLSNMRKLVLCTTACSQH